MKNKKGFVVSAVLYPLLVLFLAIIMGLLSMTDTRKRILDKMKLEITDNIFDDAACSCDTILAKLNYLISKGIPSTSDDAIKLSIKLYDSVNDFPMTTNQNGDIAVVSKTEFENYYLTDTEPTNSKEGDLWIHLKQSSKAYYRKNGIEIPIAYIEQYIEGKWNVTTSGMWNGAQWDNLNETDKETASEGTILNGYTAIVNGKKVTGSMNNGGYFKFINLQDTDPILRESAVDVYIGNCNNANNQSICVSWYTDSGAEKLSSLCNESSSDTLSSSASCTGKKVDVTCSIDSVKQISKNVVAVFWTKTTTTDDESNWCSQSTSAHTESMKITTAYDRNVTTYIASATALTLVKTLKYNKTYLNDYEETITNYKKDWENANTGSSLYRSGKLYIGKAPFSESYNDTAIFYKIDESLDESKVFDTPSSTNYNYEYNGYVTHNIAINKFTGAISDYHSTTDSAGNTTTYNSGCSTKHNSTADTYTSATDCMLTSLGARVTTFNNNKHEIEKTTEFRYSIGPKARQKLTLTSSYIDTTDLAAASNLSYPFQDSIKWMFDMKEDISKDGKNMKIDITSSPLNANGIFESTTPKITKTTTTINLEKSLPQGSSYKKSSYVYQDGKFYYIIEYSTGNVYIISEITENERDYKDKLELQIESINFYSKADGKLTGIKLLSDSNAADSSTSRYIEFYS